MPNTLHELLIIGFGNTLRGDDGVGPKVTDIVAEMKWPCVTAMSCPLLTPDLAEPIARSKEVIFVDASVEAIQEVRMREIEASVSSEITAHAAKPATLLALARDLFDHVPKAWLLSIPVKNLGIGEKFSPLAKQGLATALKTIFGYLNEKQIGGSNIGDRGSG